MFSKLTKNSILIVLVMLLAGCVGTNRILFLTKTNVGIDISREPLPTAEITIARREVGILPTYQDSIFGHDKTLPLFGAFSLSDGLFDPNISSVFAGGRAAVAIASDDKNYQLNCNQNNDQDNNCDYITLSEYPDDRGWFERLWKNKPGSKEIDEAKNQVKPFYFATDTSYGVKVGWDGTGGPYPTSLKIGYNRTEFAYPPILISERLIPVDKIEYIVKVPTFYASIENKSRFNQILTNEHTGVSQTQVFATGRAAQVWAERKQVQDALFGKIFPSSKESSVEIKK